MRVNISTTLIAVTCLVALHVKSCAAQFTQTVQLPTFHVTGVATTVRHPPRSPASEPNR